MKSSIPRLCLAACGFLLALALQAAAAAAAQTPSASAATTATTAAAPDLAMMTAAEQVRGEMAAGIINGREHADAALARLKALASPMKLPVDPGAEFGYAAIDVGRRLIAAGKPSEAEMFFRAAEASLAAVVLKTPDTQSWDKAQMLQQLSLIRSHYLNNAVQAKADIEQAIALQPSDAALQREKALLVGEHSNLFTGGAR